MTHSNQIFRDDQTGLQENFCRVESTIPLALAKKIYVTRMLTRDLFAVANLLLQT